jgi:hypothetical protein
VKLTNKEKEKKRRENLFSKKTKAIPKEEELPRVNQCQAHTPWVCLHRYQRTSQCAAQLINSTQTAIDNIQDVIKWADTDDSPISSIYGFHPHNPKHNMKLVFSTPKGDLAPNTFREGVPHDLTYTCFTVSGCWRCIILFSPDKRQFMIARVWESPHDNISESRPQYNPTIDQAVGLWKPK